MTIEQKFYGCVAGCARNYCYLFGKEVHPMIFSAMTGILLGVLILILLVIYVIIFHGGKND